MLELVRRGTSAPNDKAPACRGFSEQGAPTGAGSVAGDADRLTVARSLDRIADLTIDQSEQGVIAPDSHVAAGVKARAALPNQDRPGRNRLAAENLDAKILGWESRPFRVEPPPFFCAIAILLCGGDQAFTAPISISV